MKMYLRITYSFFVLLSVVSLTLSSKDPFNQDNTNYLLQKVFTDRESGASVTVTMSGDGNTVAIGLGSYSEIFTFTRTNGVWTSQSINIGECYSIDEGISLALSYGGDVLAIGLPSCGVAYIYVRLDDKWIPKVKIGRDASVGESVSLSLNGTICAIGAPGIHDYNNGTIFIFERSGTKWTGPQEITKADDGGFGSTICLSGDGNTLAVNNGVAIYIYHRSENGWLPPHVIPSSPQQFFLGYVTLTEDGNTLAVSGINAASDGVVWIYERTETTWQFQKRITVSDGIGPSSFTSPDIAFAANGSLLVAGSGYDNVTRGAIWVFQQDNNIWSEAQKIITLPLYQYFGETIGVSADGSTIVGGGFCEKNSTGVALVYVNQTAHNTTEIF